MQANDLGTCSWLVDELAAARIVDRDRLEPYLADFTAECPYADADAFAVHLSREGVLSKFQARRALDGEARKLLLGAYLLVDVIGTGSLGPVYKALGRSDQKPYAVKVLPQRAWNMRLARSQVRLFEQLPAHDAMVPFIDVGTSQGLHYFVWPLVEGRTLESIVYECGSLSPGEVARIGVRVAEALTICHARGLIHGLIKPSNIMVASDGQARLLDFGLGALLADNSGEDPLVDTVSRAGSLGRILECAAPECVADSSRWLPAGDQYSLGCTLYFCTTGRFPFPGGNFVDKIIHHQSHKPTPIRSLNPDVPPGLADVIDHMMHKAPADRFRRLTELIGELAPMATASRVLQPVPVNVETPPPKAKLSVKAASAVPAAPVVKEPPVLDIQGEAKRGLFGRLLSSKTSDELLNATVVTAGPVRPGDTIVVHVYVHGVSETPRLIEAIRSNEVRPRNLGTCQTKRVVANGSRVGLHLSIEGGTVGEPLQEFDHVRNLVPHRFLVSVPMKIGKGPIPGRLMVGQAGRLIAQVDFMLTMAEG
ncbi:MAG: serine/threonine protein kinase [Planctomycetes bacterium]|nr:serine/threonine protein kinase [Planctomycetota bacterium]